MAKKAAAQTEDVKALKEELEDLRQLKTEIKETLEGYFAEREIASLQGVDEEELADDTINEIWSRVQ